MEVDDQGSSQGSPGESDGEIEGSEIASPEPMDTMENEPAEETGLAFTLENKPSGPEEIDSDDELDLNKPTGPEQIDSDDELDLNKPSGLEEIDSDDELDLNETPPPASPQNDDGVDENKEAALLEEASKNDQESDDEGEFNEDDASPPQISSPVNEQSTNNSEATSSASHMGLGAPHDDHGELDYEEDVDQETSYETKKHDVSQPKSDHKEEGEEEEEGEQLSDDDTDGELDDEDDCEEGEIKDASEKQDDENDELEEGEEGIIGDDDDDDRNGGYGPVQQPVCRFFMFGTCNWGTSCRFIHPGIRTAGSYVEENMGPMGPRKSWNQDVVEPPEEEPAPRPTAPATESAWERGLRQAKELREKSKKRKENDEDFEEKRKNLTIKLDPEDLVEEKPKEAAKDDTNKENEREKIQRDPYYDGVFGDIDMPYNEKQSIDGWHGGGHYENFEVHWGGRQSSRGQHHHPHHQQQQQHQHEQYPDFRMQEEHRSNNMYKEKHGGRGRGRGNKYHQYDRYNKQHGHKEDRGGYKDFDLSHQLKKSRQAEKSGRGISDMVGGGYGRGEQWADPWQRVKSPVRRKHSSSRSRSRSRRYSRSGSYSYSSSSYSSRSRSSSYSSRSSYSRSSSSSSRSSSGSRSPSPSLRQRRPQPPTMPNSAPAAKRHSEIPRSFITKAGPIVGSRSLGGGKDNSISTKQSAGGKQSAKPSMSASQVKPSMGKPPVSKPQSSKPPEGPSKMPGRGGKQQEKPELPPSKPTGPSARQPRPAPPGPKPFSSENRPGRSLRRRTRSFSSVSSKASSSGSSSRSRSRSSSASSSSSSSADSDNLYGDMASPTKSPSPTPKHGKHRRSNKRPPPSDSHKRGGRGDAPSQKDRYRGGPNPSSRGRPQDSRQSWKQDDKRGPTSSQPAIKAPVHTAKDPLKLQGQKSSIKLTLKSNKLDTTSALRETEKKRPAVEPAGPPAKKAAINRSPVKEPKEPVRLTIPKTDKVIKPPPTKELSSKPSAPPAPKTPTKAPAKPAPEPSKPAAPAPSKKKSTSSRREELLKQLKAVEDAIARKRTK